MIKIMRKGRQRIVSDSFEFLWVLVTNTALFLSKFLTTLLYLAIGFLAGVTA